MSVRDTGFTCRICNCCSYTEVTRTELSDNRFGPIGPHNSHSWVEYYFCDECSVHFNSPRTFSATPMISDKEIEDRKRKAMNPNNDPVNFVGVVPLASLEITNCSTKELGKGVVGGKLYLSKIGGKSTKGRSAAKNKKKISKKRS